MPVGKTDYSVPVTPDEYVCAQCGATGCKLWREYQTAPAYLLCARCAAVDQEKSIDDLDGNGTYTDEAGYRTSAIDWFVPAIPTAEGGSYWGYTSVPQEGLLWWQRLPTFPLNPR